MGERIKRRGEGEQGVEMGKGFTREVRRKRGGEEKKGGTDEAFSQLFNRKKKHSKLLNIIVEFTKL